jgi:hypothetical protein
MKLGLLASNLANFRKLPFGAIPNMTWRFQGTSDEKINLADTPRRRRGVSAKQP